MPAVELEPYLPGSNLSIQSHNHFNRFEQLIFFSPVKDCGCS